MSLKVAFGANQEKEFNSRVSGLAAERKWNDSKKINLDKGQFTLEEEEVVKKALCDYVKENDFSSQDLKDLCSLDKTELPEHLTKAWTTIAKSLPTRSVQSIHNFCKRKFNPYNYSGKWSQDEEQILFELVGQHGPRWKTVCQEFNEKVAGEKKRTALNCKDKWNSLGALNHEKRVVGPWTFKETYDLLTNISVATKQKIVKKSVKVIFETEKKKTEAYSFDEEEKELRIYSDRQDLA